MKYLCGDAIRTTKFEWHPARLLCKRFNVPNPYSGSKVGTVKAEHATGLQNHYQSLMSRMQPNGNDRTQTKERDKHKASDADIQNQSGQLEHTVGKAPVTTNGMKEGQGTSESTLEQERPPLDLFKAIFDASSDDDGDSDDDNDAKNDAKPAHGPHVPQGTTKPTAAEMDALRAAAVSKMKTRSVAEGGDGDDKTTTAGQAPRRHLFSFKSSGSGSFRGSHGTSGARGRVTARGAGGIGASSKSAMIRAPPPTITSHKDSRRDGATHGDDNHASSSATGTSQGSMHKSGEAIHQVTPFQIQGGVRVDAPAPEPPTTSAQSEQSDEWVEANNDETSGQSKSSKRKHKKSSKSHKGKHKDKRKDRDRHRDRDRDGDGDRDRHKHKGRSKNGDEAARDDEKDLDRVLLAKLKAASAGGWNHFY